MVTPQMEKSSRHAMKKTLIAAALALAAFSARAQEVTYALPKTTLTVEVGYEQQIIHAGKYAKYAKDLLGLQVALADTVITNLNQFKIRPRVEADQTRRYSLNLTNNSRPALLSLTEQGLVAAGEGDIQENGGERHSKSPLGRQVGYRRPEPAAKAEPAPRKPVYEEKTVTKTDSLGNEIIETILVEVEPVDSLLLEAKEAAESILELREQRYKIVTGDTDASYSGEALGAALAELSRMEAELVKLFEGTSETVKGRAYFDIIPKREGTTPAFALDPLRGPVRATDSSDVVFYLTIKSEPIARAVSTSKAQSKKQPTQSLVYRIPAICNISLNDGEVEIMDCRFPVYQLGIEVSYPIYE